MWMGILRKPTFTNYLFTIKPDDTDGVITTVTASGAIVEFWLSDISTIDHHGIVSLDVKHHSTDNRVITVLQLGLAGRCLLFQLSHADYIPQSLHTFLAHPGLTFVGFGIHQQAKRLKEDRALVVNNTTDLEYLAAERRDRRGPWRPNGHRDLAGRLLGVSWNKPPMVETSDYSGRDLPDDEVIYASVDLISSADIGRRMLAKSYTVRDWVLSFFIFG